MAWRDPDYAYNAILEGKKTILAPYTNYYFDMYQNMEE